MACPSSCPSCGGKVIKVTNQNGTTCFCYDCSWSGPGKSGFNIGYSVNIICGDCMSQNVILEDKISIREEK